MRKMKSKDGGTVALDEMTSSTLRVSLMAGAAWHTTNRKATRHRFDHQIFSAMEQREEKRLATYLLLYHPSHNCSTFAVRTMFMRRSTPTPDGGGGSSDHNDNSATPRNVRFGSNQFFGSPSGGGSFPSPGRNGTSNGSNGSNGSARPPPRPQSPPVIAGEEEQCNAAEQIAILLLQLRTLAAMGVAALCAVGLLTLLGILFITVRPFSKPTYRRLSATLAASVFLDAMALLAPDMTICLTGDSDVPSPVGASVMVCNHLLNGDWWAMFMLGRCVGLRGSIKVFLRNEMLQGSGGGGGGGNLGSSLTMSSGEETSASTSTNGIRWLSPSNSTTNGSINGNSADMNDMNGIGFSDAFLGGDDKVPIGVRLGGHILHSLMEFPLLSAESSQNWVKDRSDLLTLLRSFADEGAPAPIHLLLYPEGWSLQGEADRTAAMAKSNEFAKREGRPQLKNLLLPRTKGFNACLESLREANPFIYDVTMAYRGYDGRTPMALNLSWPSFWDIIRGQLPSEVHFRIKRYSLGEVLGDSQWLDKQWKEKDRLLTHFAKYQQFPVEQRGYGRQQRSFRSRNHVESSVMGIVRLGIIPFMIPLILLISIPLCWLVLWMWLAYRAFDLVLDWDSISSLFSGVAVPGSAAQTPRSTGTPFFPATPFGSPNSTLNNWRSSPNENGESSNRR